MIVTYSSDAIPVNSHIARLNLTRKYIYYPGISQDKVSGKFPFSY